MKKYCKKTNEIHRSQVTGNTKGAPFIGAPLGSQRVTVVNLELAVVEWWLPDG